MKQRYRVVYAYNVGKIWNETEVIEGNNFGKILSDTERGP